MKADPSNKELQQIHQVLLFDKSILAYSMKEIEDRNKTVETRQQKQDEEQENHEKEAILLVEAFRKRNIRQVCSLCFYFSFYRLCDSSNFKLGTFKPYMDQNECLHWPLLFVYPETMQQDMVQDAKETDSLANHLDTVYHHLFGIHPLALDVL